MSESAAAPVTRAGGNRRRGFAARLRPDSVLICCLALAALATLLPAAPTYDPWAWINWGREITEFDLDTHTGPSWKPLPVMFTTPFALAGDRLAPELWLIVAQAGGLLAFAYTYRLAARLAGWPAGLIAAAGLFFADEFIRNFARANSEGLLVGFCLWAVERHLDGHNRQAFGLAAAAGLLRPELWPFLLIAGLWLIYRDRRAWPLVVGSGVFTLIAWFVPEYIGSGDFMRAATRARDPNPYSAAFAEHPFIETFGRSLPILAPPLLVGAVIALVRFPDRIRLGLAAAALLLLTAVAAMTQFGFAGNMRYVALPAALVCVLAGAGWVDLVRSAGRYKTVAAVVLALAAIPFMIAPTRALREDLDVVRAESELYDRLPPIVEAAGGRERLTACGPIYAPPFEAQAVAYALRVHSEQVGIFAAPPGTVIAGHFSALGSDPRFYEVVKNRRWAVRRNCTGG